MTYDILVETIREVLDNDLIYKEGLTLEYRLDEIFHKQLDEHFHYQTNSNYDFEHTDDFEVEIGGIIVKFIKNEK